jgi:hypothetical protein
VKKPKLLPYERMLIKHLEKRLPVGAFCTLWYHRCVLWSQAGRYLKMPPEINNSMTLRICIVDPEKPRDVLGRFEWEGTSLEEGVKTVDRWMAEQKAVAMKASREQPLLVSRVLALPAAADPKGGLFP